MKNIIYLAIGVFFGITLYKSEAASWYRIYEMFQFQSFKMYGIIGTAVVLGLMTIQVVKRSKLKTFYGVPIVINDKHKSLWRYLFGGIIFGLGWALAGACPGPMFVLVGAGFYNLLIVIIAAMFGTYVYGRIKDKLPH